MDTLDNNRSATFDRLLRPHVQRLYRLAFRLTGSKPEAEDLFQDVLVKLFTKLDELVDIEEPGTWTRRVMYNHFIDNRRRFSRRRLLVVDEGRLPQASVDAVPGNDDPQVDAERLDDIIRLDRALAELSEDHRLVVLLHDTEGYTLKEIQELTGAPVGTLKSRLHRARARLRKLLTAGATF
ncbi:MAG: RNA polymerase sigma factor [Paracoccaceae bacterium]